MGMDIFTFGVLIYNQEDIVLETLESIKYQIMNYGRGLSVRIIITDDASKDKSREIVDYWLTINSQLFSEVLKRYNVENLGTVKNYNFIMEHIESGHFKLIAGDDLISNENIFKLSESLDDITLRHFVRCYLEDEKIWVEERDLIEHFWNMKHIRNVNYLRKFVRGCYIHTPSVLYTKGMYEASRASDYNKKYKLFEDDPTWYSMIRNIDDFRIDFEDSILTIYRISSRSVSNNGIPKDSLFSRELSAFRDDLKNEVRGRSFIYLLLDNQRVPKVLRISAYINKLEYMKMKMFALAHRNEFHKFKTEIDKKVGIQNKFYSEIKNKAGNLNKMVCVQNQIKVHFK